ncbi:hypothetical protein ACFWDZ_32880 [Micromonospora aurantiaca]
MSEQTPKQPKTPASEPATPAACAKDYKNGAQARLSSEKRDAKARR